MISRKRIIYSKEFIGEMKLTDFELKTDEISVELDENGEVEIDLEDFLLCVFHFTEILCEALYLGIDGGLKSQAQFYPTGITMISGQIAKYKIL